jgi:hypothetical protein
MKKIGNKPRGKQVARNRGITTLQRRAIDNIASGKYKSKKAAMIAAGYSENTAINPTVALLKAKGGQKYLETFDGKALARFDMTLESKLQDVFLDGLEADKPFGRSGGIMPDFEVRLKYADRVAEMIGLLKSKSKDRGQVFNFFMFDKKQRSHFNEMFNDFVKQQSLES